MGQKLKIILSDLHLGAGHRERNQREDFTVDKTLVRFLRRIWQESERDRREVELIINGDLFEFLHVPAVDRFDPTLQYPLEAYLDSSEQASIKRLNLIFESHPDVFEALSDFIHVGEPQRRVTIIKGNHDVNLYWPGVKTRLREVLGATGSRSSLLLFAAEFVSREKIYVEHGHQRTEKMNSYHDFLDPRLSHNLSQLYYPAGSHFIINLFNQMGREHWFIDNIKPITTLIWYALQWNFELAVQMLADFIRHSPALVVSNYNQTSPLTLPSDDWLESLTDPELRPELTHRYQHDPVFRQEFHQHVSVYLGDANVANKDNVFSQPFQLSADPMMMGRSEQQQQQATLHRAAEQISQQEGVKVVVFGHIHRPIQETLETGGIYINTGCWITDLSDLTPAAWQKLFEQALPVTDLPLHLPYARIDYDEANQPSGQLLDFATDLIPPAPEPPPNRTSFEGKLNRLARRFFKL